MPMPTSSAPRLLFALAGACGITSLAHAQQTVYAISDGGSSLIRFPSNNPGNVTVVGSFGGAASFLDAIDFRPATGELFGYLDSADSFFSVNLSTAQLTLRSAGASAAPTNTFQLGMDFNPSIDRARVVTDSDQNIVFNPVAGTAASFTDLAYAVGDPNEAADPNIIDNAYNLNRVGLATPTQFAIDYELDTLVTLANNTGVLTTIGSLGIDTDVYTGFDIFTDAASTNTAYAILTPLGGSPRFYTVNLGTGAATLVGSVGANSDQVYSLAVIPAPTGLAILGLPLLLAARRQR